MTNGDRIRSMCDGDFADWFVKIVQDCKRCPALSKCDFTGTRQILWVVFLYTREIHGKECYLH